MPQIAIDGNYIGGYTDLKKHLPYSIDYEKLHEVTKIITENLNKVIDVNFYPTEKTIRSNLRHRPIGIGVQGLADLFALIKIPFHSDEAQEINKNIFETIYHAALEKSNEIAMERTAGMREIKKIVKEHGMNYFRDNMPKSMSKNKTTYENMITCGNYYLINPTDCPRFSKLVKDHSPIYDEISKLSDNHLGAYSSFEGSPVSQGILQFDMWGVQPSNRYDWDKLKLNIAEHGIRNSLLLLQCQLLQHHKF